MTPHYVLIIHGMGEEKEEFSKDFQRSIQSQFFASITQLKKDLPYLKDEQINSSCLTVKEVLWSDITQEEQDRLWQRLFPRLSKKRFGWLELLGNPGAWMPRLRHLAYFRQFVFNYFGDPISYVPTKDKYRRIHNRLFNSFTELHKERLHDQSEEERPAFVTVVAHSLGSVIASDLVYDMCHKRNDRTWPPQVRLANFFTLGSPLALYMLRYGMDEVDFASPIMMQDQEGLWINAYDPQDILGYPLKPLNGEKGPYDQAVFSDIEINAGQWWNPWH